MPDDLKPVGVASTPSLLPKEVVLRFEGGGEVLYALDNEKLLVLVSEDECIFNGNLEKLRELLLIAHGVVSGMLEEAPNGRTS